MRANYNIALLPGDGIGNEVIPVGVNVLNAAASYFNFTLNWDSFPWSCDYYLSTGRMMPRDGLRILKEYDAIYLGAVGSPAVPDHVSLWGLLIPIRKYFNQYVNLRPVRFLPGLSSPLKDINPGEIDILIVRENTEGEYSNVGGHYNCDLDDEYVTQESKFTKIGIDRIITYAFERAKLRKRHLTNATKSNGLTYTMPYWDDRFDHISKNYIDVATDKYHIDILAALFVKDPGRFDVIVASNLFGDILSDLGPACVGAIGIAPGANINPEREFPSMFEPVHGSAPDIYGLGIANPIGQIWSGVMMLNHLGEHEAAALVMNAIEYLLLHGPRTPDLGGNKTTRDMENAIISYLNI